MEVRTLMSLATGVLVGAFAWIAGLPFALEWGVIAFALNYIPFIGPFVATLFPTLVAMTQFGSWEAVVGVFVCLNIIQFVVGSYIEPRVSGAMLAMSPTVVLLAVFLWTYLWGLCTRPHPGRGGGKALEPAAGADPVDMPMAVHDDDSFGVRLEYALKPAA